MLTRIVAASLALLLAFALVACAAEPDAVIVVIANGADLESELKPLDGKTVVATGTRAEGVSIRMAGPEMRVEKIEEITDTPGAAE